jgi:transketolase
MPDLATLKALAQKLRRISILSTTEAGSGHPTTCMSMAEIMSVLYFDEMNWDPSHADRPGADTFVLSKGHAAPILWAALHEAGAVREDPMTLRKVTSPLEGHPTPRVPFVKVTTGSLGQGICAAVGMAIGRRMKQDPGRVYTVLGDSECAEGSVWEAAEMAAYHKVDNLCAVVDQNGLGQSGPTQHRHDTAAMAAKWRAFGWHAIEVDGHDVAALQRAFAEARSTRSQPTVVVARTEKGKGVSFVEGKEGWHGKPLSKPEAEKALAELGDVNVSVKVEARTRGTPGTGAPKAPAQPAGPPEYQPGGEIASREAYGNALVRLGALDKRIVVLDAEVKNSTYAEKFKNKYPDRFVEGLIAEQNLVGMAMGLSPEGFIPFASSFACFLERAADFVRIAAYSNMGHLILCGSHAGVSIGEDGPSQMALEDLAMMRAILTTVVLYPSDGFCAERLVEEAIAHGGIVYIRTSRPKTKVIYGIDEKFPIGGCKVHGSGKAATIVGAGVTLFEALAAQEQLKKDGIDVRVVDAYSVKPLDAKTLQKCADETGAVIVVEDHSSCGGLGDAVTAEVDAKRFVHLAVHEIPRSASPKECLSRAGIDAAAIVAAVKKL